MSTEVLRLQEVSLLASIGSAALLQQISFAVARGDRLAVIGPSGAGKTSLLRLINRLVNPTQGKIYFEERLINTIPVIKLRQKIVLVPQEPKLLGMRVKEALSYPLLLHKLPSQEIDRRVETWRNALRIPAEWLERYELQLSLGQRQLVAIARALVLEPTLLILDEPTSALDLGTANHLLGVLRQLSKNEDTTIIMVNHQLELLPDFAERILYLAAGQIQQELVSTTANWQQLREQLSIAEAQVTEEWD